MTSLTDPEENTTYWSYGPLGQVATETINVSSTDLTRSFSYDARGNLVRKVDRNGRVIDYGYDSLSRQTTETWYDDVTDADAEQNVRKTYATTYDDAGRIATVGDGDYDFAYTWSIFGNLTSTTQDLTGLVDDVAFSYTYDVLGRKTGVAASIGSADDYVNTYSYDNLGRITQITQDGVSGGNAVAEKRVEFAYSDDGTRATISRFADLAGTKAVAETEHVYDLLGRVTDIVHERAATEFADYDLAWDAAGRISDFDFESLVGDDGTSGYSYDDTNQLTGADYDFQADESHVYDENGNRTLVDGSTTYTTGDHNRLTSDGVYDYTYDNEGNVLAKTNISTSESVEYTWDHRNRLVKVTFKNSGGTATKIVEYAYDHGQRWVRKTLDTNADGTIEQSQVFVHDNGQVVLDFQKTGTAAASNSDLAHRYLWGNSVDQLLADETVDDGSEDDTAWPLTDHLNSVRDMVVYDPITGTVSVIKHVTFDAFGNVTSDSAPTLLTLFRYTSRPFDVDAELQNNLNRWYDLSTGRWMSVDPIGFEAGDVNLYRYVGNEPIAFADPTGTNPPDNAQIAIDVIEWIQNAGGFDLGNWFPAGDEWTTEYSISLQNWPKISPLIVMSRVTSEWADDGEKSGMVWIGYDLTKENGQCTRRDNYLQYHAKYSRRLVCQFDGTLSLGLNKAIGGGVMQVAATAHWAKYVQRKVDIEFVGNWSQSSVDNQDCPFDIDLSMTEDELKAYLKKSMEELKVLFEESKTFTKTFGPSLSSLPEPILNAIKALKPPTTTSPPGGESASP